MRRAQNHGGVNMSDEKRYGLINLQSLKTFRLEGKQELMDAMDTLNTKGIACLPLRYSIETHSYFPLETKGGVNDEW